MTDRPVAGSGPFKVATLEELRSKIFKDKSKYRSHLASASVAEKLRILEEMRDFTASLQHLRDENKAAVSKAWLSPAA